MGCSCTCNAAYATAKKKMQPLWATLKCLENLPIIGHILAAVYAFLGDKDKAERSGLKATIGLILGLLSFPAEIFDEIFRKKSKKLYSFSLSDRRTWMKSHHDRTLRRLCLPGSHQSATNYIEKKIKPVPMVEGWSRCQGHSVEQQLFGGIRFFDFRIMTNEEDKEIWLHHNLVLCDKFRYILDTIQDFVNENPSEIVCMHVTNDGQHVDWEMADSLINEYLGQKIVPDDMRELTIGKNFYYIYKYTGISLRSLEMGSKVARKFLS